MYAILIEFDGQWAIYREGFESLAEAESALAYYHARTSYTLKILAL